MTNILKNVLSCTFALVFTLVLAALFVVGVPGTGIASAHTHLTCVDSLGHVFATSGNICPGTSTPFSQALRCVEADGVIIDVVAASCPAGDVILSSDGLSFGGPFGARFFGPGFNFGTLSDAQTAQDANACAAAIAFIETQHLGPQHRAAAIGLIAQLQQCQNRTGTNNSSFSLWPF